MTITLYVVYALFGPILSSSIYFYMASENVTIALIGLFGTFVSASAMVVAAVVTNKRIIEVDRKVSSPRRMSTTEQGVVVEPPETEEETHFRENL